MTHRQRRRDARPAFTMIELLVVITIIAILVALTTSAVMRALNKGPELVTSSEIGEMQSKLQSVISNPASPLDLLPSRLHLSKKNNYGNSQLDKDSVAYLQKRFGRRTCFDFAVLPPAGNVFIDWNGDGVGNEELYLEGQQCLVFHLGGVPINNPQNMPVPANTPGLMTMVGFSNNQSNPALAPQANNERRQGPYFEFQSNRLVSFTSPLLQGAGFPAPPGFGYGSFPVYWDSWVRPGGNTARQPFAFFASYNTEGAGLYDKYGTSDCPSLLAATTGNPMLPYQAVNNTWLNPSSFQIISAGKDGKFGTGGVLPRSGTADAYGADDQSNFSSHLLGVAP